jgi:hypothetical protein
MPLLQEHEEVQRQQQVREAQGLLQSSCQQEQQQWQRQARRQMQEEQQQHQQVQHWQRQHGGMQSSGPGQQQDQQAVEAANMQKGVRSHSTLQALAHQELQQQALHQAPPDETSVLNRPLHHQQTHTAQHLEQHQHHHHHQGQQQQEQDIDPKQPSGGARNPNGSGSTLCGKRKAEDLPGDEAMPQAGEWTSRLPEAAAVAAPGTRTAPTAGAAQPCPNGQSSSSHVLQGAAAAVASHVQGVMVVADQATMEQLQQLLCKPGSTWAFSLHLDGDGLSPGAAGSGGVSGMVLPRPMPKKTKAAVAAVSAPGLAELEQQLEQEAHGAVGGQAWGWQLMGVAFSVRDGAAFYVPLSSCSRRRGGMLWQGLKVIMQSPGVTKVRERILRQKVSGHSAASHLKVFHPHQIPKGSF